MTGCQLPTDCPPELARKAIELSAIGLSALRCSSLGHILLVAFALNPEPHAASERLVGHYLDLLLTAFVFDELLVAEPLRLRAIAVLFKPPKRLTRNVDERHAPPIA